MKKLYLLFALLAFLVIITENLFAKDFYSPTVMNPSPAVIQRGEAIYKSSCMRCHGATGTNSPRRDVKPIAYMHPQKIFEELVEYKTEDDFFNYEERAMIDVVSKMSYDELEAVSAYVGTMRARTAPPRY
ncbi:MAG: c-type cytochrome [Desulfovibrionaceae bacterium]